MLAARFTSESLADMLLSRTDWHPYPKASERSAWEALDQDLRAELVAAGEGALATPWQVVPATRVLDFVRDGNRSRCQAIIFSRRQKLLDLTLAECAEGQGRFVDEIVNGVWLTCEETYWGLPAHLGMQKTGAGLPDIEDPIVDLFVAETAAQLSWTWYLLGDELDAASSFIGPRLHHEVDRQVLTPCLEREPFNWMGFHGNPVNNWNPWINSNWLTALLLMEPDSARRAAGVWKSLRSIDYFIKGYPADGGCDEGPGYWGRAGASLYDWLELMDLGTDGQFNVFEESLVQEMGRFICRAYIADGWGINFADAGARVSPAAGLVYRFGRAIGDPVMQGYGAFLAEAGGGVSRRQRGSLGRILPDLFGMAGLEDATAAVPLIRDAWLPDTQVCAARQQEGSATGLYLAAKGGHNAESHNHNDVGQFMVYADGKPVIVDAGVEEYTAKTFSPDRYSIWTMQSQYHNLPTVNGVMQAPGRSFAARDLQYSATDDAVTFALDIAGAYPPEAGLQSWRRRFVFDRRAGTVEVTDNWQFDQQPGAVVVLHLLTPSQVSVAESGVITLGAAALPGGRRSGELVLTVTPAAGDLQVETIPVTDGNLRGVWGDSLNRLVFSIAAPGVSGRFQMSFAPCPASQRD